MLALMALTTPLARLGRPLRCEDHPPPLDAARRIAQRCRNGASGRDRRQMVRRAVRAGFGAALMVLGGGLLAGCEDLARFVQDNPKVVHTIGHREVMIVDRQF